MQPRFSTTADPAAYRAMSELEKYVHQTSLEVPLIHIVKLYASIINHCAYCIDMHTKEAAHAGETALRLHLVAAWRETTVFTEAERAALELTEQGTRLADGGVVTDEVWANAAKHFDEEQLMALVAQICLINAFNRLNVITRTPGGEYQLGQHA